MRIAFVSTALNYTKHQLHQQSLRSYFTVPPAAEGGVQQRPEEREPLGGPHRRLGWWDHGDGRLSGRTLHRSHQGPVHAHQRRRPLLVREQTERVLTFIDINLFYLTYYFFCKGTVLGRREGGGEVRNTSGLNISTFDL